MVVAVAGQVAPEGMVAGAARTAESVVVCAMEESADEAQRMTARAAKVRKARAAAAVVVVVAAVVAPGFDVAEIELELAWVSVAAGWMKGS